MKKLIPTTVLVLLIGAGATLSGTAARADAATPVPSSATSQPSASVINGPLINGPVLDLGGVLNNLQIGQFQ